MPMFDTAFQGSMFFEYWKDGKMIGAIEIQPEFKRDGCLVKWHSRIIKWAMRNEHPDGTKCDAVKIFHGNPYHQI